MSLRELTDRVEFNKLRLSKSKWNEIAIMFHYVKNENIKWKEIHNYIETIWQENNITPTYGQPTGLPFFDDPKKYHLPMKSYKGTKRKLEKFNYEGLLQLSLRYVPKEENDVAKYLSNLSIVDDSSDFQRSMINFSIADNIKPFDFKYFVNIARYLQEYSGALYGYCFEYPEYCDPSSYMFGLEYTIIDATTTIKEHKRQMKWTIFEDDKNIENKFTYLRDIYRLNFISKIHLSLVIDDKGGTLGERIKANPLGVKWELGELGKDFYYWYIEDENRFPDIINALSRIVICNYDELEEYDNL